MLYKDEIYGPVEITDPVVLKIIENPGFQRLKGIDQAGRWKPYFPGKPINRFQHSIGVYLLLKRYLASREEQLAGLIHDVSHAAFSHCIDYALKTGSGEYQDHQDKVFQKYIHKTEIPDILKKYKLNVSYIFDDKNFPLKEMEIPDLCSDRIDYALRTAYHTGEIKKGYVNKILSKLTVKNRRWVFVDCQSAASFARLFRKLNRKYYAGRTSALMFSSVGDWLAYGLAKNYLTHKDLYSTDKEVIQKLSLYNKTDKKIAQLWKQLNHPGVTRIIDKNNKRQIVVKSRIVDPFFIDKDGKIKRLSEKLINWKRIVIRELKPKKYFV